MKHVYTVKEVQNYIKGMLDRDVMLRNIYIKGEVSNCSYKQGMYLFFSLKEGNSLISAFMYQRDFEKLGFRLQDGQQVIVLGQVSLYPRDGNCQITAREVIMEGVGLLYQKFEALKNQLEAMGVFSSVHKKPIPAFPKKIGIVTAANGAAVRDIIQVAQRRNPYIQLILYPVQVQGEAAAPSIIEGIHALEVYGVDVMIVGRGGGKIEDLWAFNEEAVAHAIFKSPVPIITGIGHETDTTISDYVSDRRAPTPSAAAELAVYRWDDVKMRLDEADLRLRRQMKYMLQTYEERLQRMRQSVLMGHPLQRLNQSKQEYVLLGEKLSMQMENILKRYRHDLEIFSERLSGFSPLKKLSGGYAYVETTDGQSVRSIKDLRRDEKLHLYLADGRMTVTIDHIDEKNLFAVESTESTGEEKTDGK